LQGKPKHTTCQGTNQAYGYEILTQAR
jgi:hypothetical protein